MQPQLKLLDDALVERIISEGFDLLQDPGVKVYSDQGLTLLADAGVDVDFGLRVARIPQSLVEKALETAPSEFALYDGDGSIAVRYGGDHVQFDPGSSAVNILDGETGEHRQPITADYVRYAQLIEMLPAYDAISTAFVCSDVVEQVGDLYRLYLTLLYSKKPVVTGAFRVDTLHLMKDLLVADAGCMDRLAAKPRAVFDVCPSPPLVWSELTCQNLIDLAGYRIPAEVVSMPLAGSTAPVTLVGAVVQHTAECMSGVAVHQLAGPGAPIVWGGAPAITDMRFGSTPMGAIETSMIDAACAQVGKRLNMPTHAYLCASDSKLVDAQAGFESGMSALMGAMAGVNMISGAGMLDFLRAQSLEKLVIDAEIIAMVRRLLRGIRAHEPDLGSTLIRKVGHHGEFLSQKHTRTWFAQEQHIPSGVVDRGSLSGWRDAGSKTTLDRAHDQVRSLLAAYQPRSLPGEVRRTLYDIMERAARQFGMEHLPPLPAG
ncbi:MAG: trimethylamine methyltransferase family protein [Anaerolineales bacterium]|nr:MAG: trimethylamine methyltransferase family protein [Anaerolineales bacterium]